MTRRLVRMLAILALVLGLVGAAGLAAGAPAGVLAAGSEHVAPELPLPAAGRVAQESTPLEGVARLAAGFAHTCAVMTNGEARCWGENDDGQLGDGTTIQRNVPVVVSDLSSGVAALVAGMYHTCALVGGEARCWGANWSGQLGDGTSMGRLTPVEVSDLDSEVTALAAGYAHTCAVTDGGGAMCWGANGSGQLGNGATADSHVPVQVSGLISGVTALVAGESHACALTASGGAKCWGANGSGQLGNGTTVDSHVPVQVSGLTSGVTALAAGWNHTCALMANGAVRCWGNNRNGQLGDGTTVDRWTPVGVNNLADKITALAAGQYHTCSLTASGGARCWGWSGHGQLGDGTYNNSGVPVYVNGLASGVTALAAGAFHTCAVTAGGQARCWGNNYWNQLGDGTIAQRSLPLDVGGLTGGVTALAAGEDHTCALTASGGARCWGANWSGQLGDGTTTWRLASVEVSGLVSGVRTLVAGPYHTCALMEGGGVRCWGENESGQLGDGTTDGSTVPVGVNGLDSGVTALAAGWDYTCAALGSGGVRCWGENKFGQLGDGTTDSSSMPVQVSGLSGRVMALAGGEDHTCAMLESGEVWCWGANKSGQLGNGTTTNSSVPVQVSGLTGGTTALVAGRRHTCAAIGSGIVQCWGANAYGQLGNGTIANSSVPVQVSSLTGGIVALAAGEYHTCAVTTGGKTRCWGDNADGQLGDGTFTPRSAPVNVSGLASGGLALAAGKDHTCAVITNQRAKCWGRDDHSQLGLGTVTRQPAPVAVVASIPPHLGLNYVSGRPGSLFTLTGTSFPASSQAAVSVNGTALTTTLPVNKTGGFIVFLNMANADAGWYNVTVAANPSATIGLALYPGAPLHPQEGGGTVLAVPAGTAAEIFIAYVPWVSR